MDWNVEESILERLIVQIILIAPTEAACERVFSARREIMTKHISYIWNDVVEARVYFKASNQPGLKKHV